MENESYWRVQIPCRRALGMSWFFSVWSSTMDKLQLIGWNLGRVFNSRSSCVRATQLHCFEKKLPNLMLKTWPRQLLGSLPIDIVLPGSTNYGQTEKMSSKLKRCYKLGAFSTKDVRCNIKAKNGPFWKVQKRNSWFLGRCDTQHKDIQHNYTQHNNKNTTLSIMTLCIMTPGTKCCCAESRFSWLSRLFYCYAEYRYTECCYAEGRGSDLRLKIAH